MIPTFIIDEPALIFIGLLSGYFIPKDWQGSLFKTRAFLAGSVIALGFIAIAAYSYTLAPDWMFMYLVPARQIPLWMVVYALILYYVLFLAGFFLHLQLRRLHPALPTIALLISLAASVLVVLPLKEEYMRVAGFEEFHRGGGVPLPESKVGKSSTIPGIALVVVGIALLFWSKGQKKPTA